MIVTEFTKRALAMRRESKRLIALGYRLHETDWEILRGGRHRERIVDAKISADGKHVWTLLSGSADSAQ